MNPNIPVALLEIERTLKSPLFDFADRLVGLPWIRNHFFRWTRRRVPVFLLHRAKRPESGIQGFDVGEVMTFVDNLLACGFNVISLQEVIRLATEGQAPAEPVVAFTADDGYVDQAEVLGKEFAARGLPLTIFLITDFMDGQDWPWDAKVAFAFGSTKRSKARLAIGNLRIDFDLSSQARKNNARREVQLICKSLTASRLDSVFESLFDTLGVQMPSEPPPEFAPMSWQQARDLESHGITFAPHSRTHRVLANLPEEDVVEELAGSWDRIASELNNSLKVIAWPIGRSIDFRERECRIAESLGFSGAIAARDRYTYIAANTDLFLLDRFGLSTEDSCKIAWRTAAGMRRANLTVAARQTPYRRTTDRNALSGMSRTPTTRSRRLTRAGSLLSTCAGLFGVFRRPQRRILHTTRRLVFVCQGNICRSPYAEILARSIGLPALSCGVSASGSAVADEIAARVAFGRGVDLSDHTSVNISKLKLGPGDLLLGMEPRHLETLRKVSMRSGAHLSLLGLWASPKRPWIADPYGLRPEAFDRAFELIEESLIRLKQDLSHLVSDR